MSVFECRWGILATGHIASVFTKDLLANPITRGVLDVRHVVAAAASSDSAERARRFLDDCPVPASTAAAYGSYEELVTDASLDVIYIASPHSHHFEHCLLALRAGRNVVCEKPFTVNAPQLQILIDLARARSLFMMEAVWTRFLPISAAIRDLIRDGAVGQLRRVTAELNLPQEPLEERYPGGQHRMVNRDLAGGALLDLGVYSLTWVYQCLYHTLPEADKEAAKPRVSGTILRYQPTGVDAENAVVCSFPHAIGIASSSIRIGSENAPPVRISGTRGEIQVAGPAYRPQSYSIVRGGKVVETKQFPIPGQGMFWEADAAARAIRDGMTECEVMPLRESLLIMEAMDRVRSDNGFRYPEAIEKTDR